MIPRSQIPHTRRPMPKTDSTVIGNALLVRRSAVVGLGAKIIGCDISESRSNEIKPGRVNLLDGDRVPMPIHTHQAQDLTAVSAAFGMADNVGAGQAIVLTPYQLRAICPPLAGRTVAAVQANAHAVVVHSSPTTAAYRGCQLGAPSKTSAAQPQRPGRSPTNSQTRTAPDAVSDDCSCATTLSTVQRQGAN